MGETTNEDIISAEMTLDETTFSKRPDTNTTNQKAGYKHVPIGNSLTMIIGARAI